MNKTSAQTADILLSIGAISINPKKPFRYTSGLLSPVYSDLRLLMSYPKQRRQVVDAWIKLIKKQGKFDLIAATATAGIPHGAWISDQMNLPMVYVRSEAKKHGKQNQIEGLVKKGQKAVVVEDLISTAGSSLETLRAIKKAGGKVNDIVAIFSYTLPQSAKNLSTAKVNLITLTTFPDVVKRAAEKKILKTSEQDLVLDWLADSAGWGKRHKFE